MPRKVKKRRKAVTEDGTDAGWEEYYDYIFPDDQVAAPSLKLLALAKQWKKAVPGAGENDEDEEEEEESSEEEESEEEDDEEEGKKTKAGEVEGEEEGKKDIAGEDADTDAESSSDGDDGDGD